MVPRNQSTSSPKEDWQGWRSGESARLPPMWSGFDSRTRRHMWVEFVVVSRLYSEGFSPGSPVFLPPQKPTFLNFNSTWNARTPLNEFLELFGASWVNKLHLHRETNDNTLIVIDIHTFGFYKLLI